MRAKLTKELQHGHRTLKPGRWITVTRERYEELLRGGFFGEKIIVPKKEPIVKKQIVKDEEE